MKGRTYNETLCNAELEECFNEPSSRVNHLPQGIVFPMEPSSPGNRLPQITIFPRESSYPWPVFPREPSSPGNRLPQGTIFPRKSSSQGTVFPREPSFPGNRLPQGTVFLLELRLELFSLSFYFLVIDSLESGVPLNLWPALHKCSITITISSITYLAIFPIPIKAASKLFLILIKTALSGL